MIRRVLVIAAVGALVVACDRDDPAAVITRSADHPDDTFWFRDVGWLNPAQVAEQDGKTFLATCAPDPGK